MIPLWMPTTGPWRTGWLLAAIEGVAFRVVADVDEQLAGAGGHRDSLEQHRSWRPLLHERGIDVAYRAVGIADGVSASLGDCRQQGLRGERPVDARARGKAIAGNAAHQAARTNALKPFSVAVDTEDDRLWPFPNTFITRTVLTPPWASCPRSTRWKESPRTPV